MAPDLIRELEKELQRVTESQVALQSRVDKAKYDLHELIASQAVLELEKMRVEDAIQAVRGLV